MRDRAEAIKVPCGTKIHPQVYLSPVRDGGPHVKPRRKTPASRPSKPRPEHIACGPSVRSALTAAPLGGDGLRLGVAGGTMTNTRDELVDRRMGANAAPAHPDVKENKGPRNHTASNEAPAHPRWLRPLADFDRRERREFQVARYG